MPDEALKPEEIAPEEPAVVEAPDVEPEPVPQVTPDELEDLRANEVAYSWQASEYVDHQKGIIWNIVLLGGVIALVALAAWLKFWLSVGAFVVMGAAVFIYAHKPPRTLTYELTSKGITIDGKFYDYSEFRSFGVLPDIEWHTIDLDPVKRLSPQTSLLFEEDDFDIVVGHLELHLPRIDRRPDAIERISRHLRF